MQVNMLFQYSGCMKRLMDKVLGLTQVIDGVDRLSYDLNKKGFVPW